MKFDKQHVIDMLREQGNHEQAKKAERELPDQVDHEEHGNILQQFGVDPQKLLSKLK